MNMKRIIGLFSLVFLATSVFADDAIVAQPPRVLVIGDSLSSAHGIEREDGWVSLLQKRLESRGYPHQVINRSKHGLTTRRALRDVSWFVETSKPDIVLIELGGVDGFLDLPIYALRENLTELVEKAGAGGAKVALFEMVLPPDAKDGRYVDEFRGTYREVARSQGARLVPFFMASFAAHPANFQPDGIHPRAEMQSQMLNAVWPTVQKLLPPPQQTVRASAPPRQSANGAGGGQH
jgi:acyl-CoA thioesterase I